MKTYYKDYRVTASITDKSDGTARLLAKDPSGKAIHDKAHKNRRAAMAVWRRMCN